MALPPLHQAAKQGKAEVVRKLLRAKMNIEEASTEYPYGRPLHYARSVEVVWALLDGRAEIEAANKFGERPLHLAGTAALVRALLDGKAAVEATDRWEQRPLHCAANVEVARALLDGKASTEAKNADRLTPLHHAARWDWTEVAHALLQAKADTEARDREGQKPLHFAAMHGRTEVAKVLLEAKADAQAKDSGGKRPLDYAEISRPEVLRAFRAKPEVRPDCASRPLNLAARDEEADVLRSLLEATGDTEDHVVEAEPAAWTRTARLGLPALVGLALVALLLVALFAARRGPWPFQLAPPEAPQTTAELIPRPRPTPRPRK